MFKKLLLIGVFCISVMALVGTEAKAYPPGLGGWGACPWCSPALTVTTDWVGIANTDLKPTEVWLTLNLTSVEIVVLNPGGEDGGIGVPFCSDIILTQSASITDVPLRGKGRYELPFYFTSQEILDALEWAGCYDPKWKLPNENWELIVIVHEFDARIQGFTDMNGRCEGDSNEYNCTESDMEEVVHAIGDCIITYDGDGEPVLGVPYHCTEVFHWEYQKKKSPTCEFTDPDDVEQPCVYEFPNDPFDWWNF